MANNNAPSPQQLSGFRAERRHRAEEGRRLGSTLMRPHDVRLGCTSATHSDVPSATSDAGRSHCSDPGGLLPPEVNRSMESTAQSPGRAIAVIASCQGSKSLQCDLRRRWSPPKVTQMCVISLTNLAHWEANRVNVRISDRSRSGCDAGGRRENRHPLVPRRSDHARDQARSCGPLPEGGVGGLADRAAPASQPEAHRQHTGQSALRKRLMSLAFSGQTV
jgi:hypothetical protein